MLILARSATQQIAPIWSNDQRSTDFTELLRHSHDIFKINKRFCSVSFAHTYI